MTVAPTNPDLLQALCTERPEERSAQITSIVKMLLERGESDLHEVIEKAVCHRVLDENLPRDTGWIADLVAALPDDVFDIPLVVDSESPRADFCETLLLAAAIVAPGDKVPEKLTFIATVALTHAPRRPWRIGHVLVRPDPERRRAFALPIFAAYLAYNQRDSVRDCADELDEDRAVQRLMASRASCAEIAEQWLTSPARRLARSPERTLAQLGFDYSLAPSKRLLDAVGLSEPSSAIPGSKDAGHTWKPTNDESPADLLRTLASAPTAWQRNRALYVLLARPRVATLAGVEVDLHREAALHVALALGDERTHGSPLRGFGPAEWLRFESATLQHGAVVATRAASENVAAQVRAAWAIGDWVGRVLRESPFLGADPEILATRLEAIFPALPAVEDPLWPTHMGTGNPHVNLGEVWLLQALLRAQAEARWDPPGAVLDGLRRLAGRTLTEGERRAEEQLEGGTNALGWSCAHVAPPLVARWLLHAHRATWLGALKAAARKETLDYLERWMRAGRVGRGVWIMLAIYREVATLGDDLQHSQSIWIEAMDRLSSGFLHVGDDALGPFCLWGVVHVEALAGAHATNLVRLAQRTPPTWRVGVLVALADAMSVPELASASREALLALMASKSASDRALRLPASIAAFQAARKLPPEQRQSFLDRVEVNLDDELRAHPNIRLELKRVGRAA